MRYPQTTGLPTAQGRRLPPTPHPADPAPEEEPLAGPLITWVVGCGRSPRSVSSGPNSVSNQFRSSQDASSHSAVSSGGTNDPEDRNRLSSQCSTNELAVCETFARRHSVDR
jgi:hypothetical protein